MGILELWISRYQAKQLTFLSERGDFNLKPLRPKSKRSCGGLGAAASIADSLDPRIRSALNLKFRKKPSFVSLNPDLFFVHRKNQRLDMFSQCQFQLLGFFHFGEGQSSQFRLNAPAVV